MEHAAPYTPAIFLGKEPIPIDTKILGMLERDHQITPEKAEVEIQKNKFTNTTTSYYLLLKRKERAGIFRQQYNDEVKKLLKKRKPKEAPPAITGGDSPAIATSSKVPKAAEATAAPAGSPLPGARNGAISPTTETSVEA